jgi:hypothetical protein
MAGVDRKRLKADMIAAPAWTLDGRTLPAATGVPRALAPAYRLIHRSPAERGRHSQSSASSATLVLFRGGAGRRSAAKLLTKNEARWITLNVVKFPNLLRC